MAAADTAEFRLVLQAENLVRNARRSSKEIDKLVASMAKLGASKDPLAGRVPASTRQRSSVPTAAAPRTRRAGGGRTGDPTAGIDREFNRMLKERQRQEQAAARQAAREQSAAARVAARQAALGLRADKSAHAAQMRAFNQRHRAQVASQKQLARLQATAQRQSLRQEQAAHRLQMRALNQRNRALVRQQRTRVGRPVGVRGAGGRPLGGVAAGGGRGGTGGVAAMGVIGTLGTAAAAAVAAVGVAFGVASVNAGRFAQSSRFALTQLIGDSGKASAEFDDVRRIAESMALPVEDAVGGFRKLIAAQFEVGQAKDLIKMSGDLQAIGATAEEAQRAIFTITQIKSKGRLQGEELLQLQEAGLSGELVFKQLEKKLGKDRDAVQKALSAGKIGSDVAIAAIMDAVKDKTGVAEFGEAGQRFADSTLDGFIGRMKGKFKNLAIDVGDKLMPALMAAAQRAMPAVDMVFVGIAAAADRIAPVLGGLLDDISGLAVSLVSDPAVREIGGMLTDAMVGGLAAARELLPTLLNMARDTMGAYQTLFRSIRDAWPNISRAAQPFISTLKIVAAVGTGVGRTVIRAIAIAIDGWSAVAGPVLDVFGAIASAAGKAVDWMAIQFRRVKAIAMAIWESIPAPIRAGIEASLLGSGVKVARKLFGADEADRFAQGMEAGESAAAGTLAKVQETGKAIESIFGKQEASNDNKRPNNVFGLAEGKESNLEWMRLVAASQLDPEDVLAPARAAALAATGTDGMPSSLAPGAADQAKAGAVIKTQTNNLTAPITINMQLAELGNGETLGQFVRRQVEAALDKMSNND